MRLRVVDRSLGRRLLFGLALPGYDDRLKLARPRRWPRKVIDYALQANHLWRWNGYPIEHCPDLLELEKSKWPRNFDETILAAAEIETRRDGALLKKADLPVLVITSFEPAWEMVERKLLSDSKDDVNQVLAWSGHAHPRLLRRVIERVLQHRTWERHWMAVKILLAILQVQAPNKDEFPMEPLLCRILAVLDGAPASPGYLGVVARGI